MAKKLSIAECELIKEMCYTNTDDKIMVELNRIRKSMDITQVVTREYVAKTRRKMGLHKTKGIKSVVKKKNNETS